MKIHLTFAFILLATGWTIGSPNVDDPVKPEERKKHWSFKPLAEFNADLSIDSFIEKKLLSHGLTMSPEADRQTWIRRVYFDLIGLPPSPDQVKAFLSDSDSNAYERVVNQLLNSPRYGELMANIWMDVARYADSDGYLDDKHRDFSPWRDWVIKAFNENMPYDQFVTNQLAGDLIKNANQESIKATAFNRLHKKNSEAGIIFEEYRSEYVADRTITFGSAFLGMTLECARCHDHKYDPISQKNFYELSSFFNNTFEMGSAVYGPGQIPGPSLLLTNQKEQELIKYIEDELEIKQKD